MNGGNEKVANERRLCLASLYFSLKWLKWAQRDWHRFSDPLHVIDTALVPLITGTDLTADWLDHTGDLSLYALALNKVLWPFSFAWTSIVSYYCRPSSRFNVLLVCRCVACCLCSSLIWRPESDWWLLVRRPLPTFLSFSRTCCLLCFKGEWPFLSSFRFLPVITLNSNNAYNASERSLNSSHLRNWTLKCCQACVCVCVFCLPVQVSVVTSEY